MTRHKEGTILNVDNIMELLTFVLWATYVRFGVDIYQQKMGVVMGRRHHSINSTAFGETSLDIMPTPDEVQMKTIKLAARTASLRKFSSLVARI